ncbi:60S ribosomal protein L27A [Penicillium verhagenii]|nr:60S ribosomal protein L27A [Penicillium verhagenii]
MGKQPETGLVTLCRLFRTPTTKPANLAAYRDLRMKFMKVGRVAIITRGRFAGKKVVIVQPSDTGSKAHPFPFAIVAGIERYPSKVTRRMGKKLVDRRSKVKPFIKVVNYNHLMPTRYTLELEGLKGVVSAETFKEVSQREDAKKTIKKALEDRYTSGKNRWFFTPLRF